MKTALLEFKRKNLTEITKVQTPLNLAKNGHLCKMLTNLSISDSGRVDQI
jgi:hypothetical protein